MKAKWQDVIKLEFGIIREKFQCIEVVKEIVQDEIFKKTLKSLMRELARLLD